MGKTTGFRLVHGFVLPQNMSHDQREILQFKDVAAKAAEEELVTLTAEEQVGCLTWWDWEIDGTIREK